MTPDKTPRKRADQSLASSFERYLQAKGKGRGGDDANYRRNAARELERWGIETRTAVQRGDPADEILAAEDEYEPTAILVGPRGHSRLCRLLLGSVSEDIVARAKGNVMLVPPDRTT
ncbi:universal stress protein (plasmid) [Natrinema zhouii]|uniref:universal stress protein n=1 Tax=Natrinema zhouii TaxID=1710539 RepID=UPI001D001677|nr:universal stress protein [Natrinema zhouii]UHQ98039.1 universal stress protein [Natrinema zhouii]